jgi:hypothetical protein
MPASVVPAGTGSGAEMQTDGSAPLGCFVLNEPRPAVEREQLRERLAARIERGQMEGDVPEDTDAR